MAYVWRTETKNFGNMYLCHSNIEGQFTHGLSPYNLVFNTEADAKLATVEWMATKGKGFNYELVEIES